MTSNTTERIALHISPQCLFQTVRAFLMAESGCLNIFDWELTQLIVVCIIAGSFDQTVLYASLDWQTS